MNGIAAFNFDILLIFLSLEWILDATERVVIDNLLEASVTEIVEIMTPRTRIDFLRLTFVMRA